MARGDPHELIEVRLVGRNSREISANMREAARRAVRASIWAPPLPSRNQWIVPAGRWTAGLPSEPLLLETKVSVGRLLIAELRCGKITSSVHAASAIGKGAYRGLRRSLVPSEGTAQTEPPHSGD